ncbi:MAG: hypothetical protein HY014_02120 [Acidobacteria bacterium]|nr:hypothetical protein [Acidobacteriota bacterium]MBI3486944.1 hypothetical protein [Acidobacteriota bacterium]
MPKTVFLLLCLALGSLACSHGKDPASPAVLRTLTVNLGAGVTGNPAATASYPAGSSVSYAFAPQPGYWNLQVTLNGRPVPNPGTVIMGSAQAQAQALAVSAAPLPDAATDILAILRGVAGVSEASEGTATVAGTRFFNITFTQPVDHHAFSGASFPQSLTLLYRSRLAPMVLSTAGYSIPRTSSQGEPTRLLQANQLYVEHRFFSTSTPSPMDWTKLDIFQAAHDEHRVVQAFKPLFAGKWLSTGGSKGGMTATYHRRFFPEDVDATLAYVAPQSYGDTDSRYIPFLQARGGAANRAAIEAWQQAVLDHREQVRALFEADASNRHETLDLLGSDKALELAVLEAPFTLWQFGDSTLATTVPASTAPAADLYAFLDASSFGVVKAWGDRTLLYFQPYYFQAATQLGYPATKDSHLKGLKYPGADAARTFPPIGIPKVFDSAAMLDVQAWVSNQATRMMFIYGENDPYTAAAFVLGSAAQARDNHLYIVPGGNHGARLATLPDPQRTEAYVLLSGWMGVTVQPERIQARTATAQPPLIDANETFLDLHRLQR